MGWNVAVLFDFKFGRQRIGLKYYFFLNINFLLQ